MKKKNSNKITAVIMMFVMAAVIFTGCAESIQTNEEIVVPKESKEESQSEGLAASGAAQGNLLNGIADQVQAPERYTTEFSENRIHVKVDAPVIIPMTAGFKLYKVTGRAFTQEDYDTVNHVLLKDGKLWDRDHEKMEKSRGFTRAEIEERIKILKEQQAGNGGSKIVAAKEKTYEELIGEWEELLKEAPEEPVIAEIPPIVCHTEDPEELEENPDKNYLMGHVTVEGKDYFVALDNNLKEDWRWIQFEVRGPQSQGSYMPVSWALEETLDVNISPEKVREDAKALMKSLGFDDFAVSGEEYVQSYSFDEYSDEAKVLNSGYEIYFTRELNGIPVTYTHEPGTTVEDSNHPSWPYEAVNLTYGEEGLLDFLWINPCEVEESGDEYVFLLPFSDIQAVFEKMIPKKYADRYQDTSVEIYYEIDEIRLGYMRVREKGNAKEGTMIPVWDFFGSETIIYNNLNDKEQTNVKAGSYESLFTINAMDGTVIDRGLGY